MAIGSGVQETVGAGVIVGAAEGVKVAAAHDKGICRGRQLEGLSLAPAQRPPKSQQEKKREFLHKVINQGAAIPEAMDDGAPVRVDGTSTPNLSANLSRRIGGGVEIDVAQAVDEIAQDGRGE